MEIITSTKQKENDERLKSWLIEKSKNGYAILTAYVSDLNKIKRKNTKRSKILEKEIINAGFAYKKVSVPHNNFEIEYDFIVFDKFDDGFNETGMRLAEFIDMCRLNKYYLCFSVLNTNIEDYLKKKVFYHPIRKSEKEDYLKRKEIILTDLWEPPENINNWYIRKVFSEDSILYQFSSHDILCSIKLQPDGSWLRHYGTMKPVGASIKKEYFPTREEAFSIPLNYHKDNC